MSSECSYMNCSKKIPLTGEIIGKCKCQLIHCILHRLPEKHQCKYDFKKDTNVEEFIKKNKCIAEKMANKI
jgi:hypothetical protein